MMGVALNDSNFLLFAAKHYDNINCFSSEEFYEDLNRIKYIKKIFTKFLDNGEIKERLVLNHIIALSNVFGVVPTVYMLFWKLKDHREILKPFLVFLKYLPDKLICVGDEAIINTSDIPMNPKIIELLRKI